MTTALGGLRVVELGCGLPASYATKLLGLLGADVVKVEPLSGDPERGRGPFAADTVDRERGGGLFRYLNADKHSVLLDPGAVDDEEMVLARLEPRWLANDTGSRFQSRSPWYQAAVAAAAPAAASTPANFAAQAFWQSSAIA